MKKIVLASALALFGFMNAQQTEPKSNFKIGVNAGLPVGKLSDFYSFNAGADIAFTGRIAENLDLGITAGYSHYFVKDLKDVLNEGTSSKDLKTIPVAVTSQYKLGDSNLFLGADLGYAFYIDNKETNNLGLFYYQPKIGYSFDGKHDLYVAYKGIFNDETDLGHGTFNLGYAIKF